MDISLNIIDSIEKNPIVNLSSTYQNKLLAKIKDNFNDTEQQLFVTSFYCYLNFDKKNDFIIDLDDIWKWLGFSQKDAAKRVLTKNFNANIDYKVLLSQLVEQKKDTRGGHNKETIMLNIDTFKKFCLKAGTKKADEIHDYYIKLEELLQETINEETNELRLQLEEKNNQLKNKQLNIEMIREKTLLEQFPNNTQCVYYGLIDNLSDKNEKLVKFGNSNNLKLRINAHKDTYNNFRLVNVFKVNNKLHIEKSIKQHPFFSERQRTITIKNKKFVELISVDNISLNEIDKHIKNIITNIEFSPENYIKILEENNSLKKKLEEKKVIEDINDIIMITNENKKLKIDNLKLVKKYNTIKNKLKKIKGVDTDFLEDVENNDINIIDIENYNANINVSSKDYTKNSDGTINANNNTFSRLYGSRKEVWDGIAFKTSGQLIKNDLLINKYGKIVSKKKCIHETNINRFGTLGVNKNQS